MTDLPLYKCHKLVRAAKIYAIEFDAAGDAAIAIRMPQSLVVRVNGYRARFCGGQAYDPHSADLGYYVVYEDGYESWSPSKAFEEGYTRVEESAG